jgi:hypothetical protein
MNIFTTSWSAMPWQSALCFAFAGLLLICLLTLVISARRDPVQVELRAIRRRKHHLFVSNKKLAKRRLEMSLQTQRAFMRTFRDAKRSPHG